MKRSVNYLRANVGFGTCEECDTQEVMGNYRILFDDDTSTHMNLCNSCLKKLKGEGEPITLLGSMYHEGQQLPKISVEIE